MKGKHNVYSLFNDSLWFLLFLETQIVIYQKQIMTCLCIMQFTMTLKIMTYMYNAVYHDIKDYDIHV